MSWFGTFPWSPVYAVVVVVALCVYGRRGAPPAPDDPWQWRVDGPLILASAVGFAVVAGWVLAPRHLLNGDYIDVDLAVYCTGLSVAREGALTAWPGKLSLFSAHLLAAPASAFGILPTLTGGAILSAGVFGGALFAWVRAAAGRLGGLCAVILALSNSQLVLLSRNPSFYAETTAACTVGMAAIAAAVRWRTPATLLAGGAGVGLVLLADTRFLSMGVAGAALVLLAATPGALRRLPLRLALVVLPVVASWWLSHAWFTQKQTNPGDYVSGTVGQAAAFLRDVPGYPMDAATDERARRADHAWGHDSVAKVPAALVEIAAMASRVPPERAQSPDVVNGRAANLDPWALPLGLAALAGAYTLRKRPWALLAGFGTVAPFVANLAFVVRTLPQPRVLALGMIAVPVLLGMGLGDPSRRWNGRRHAVLLLALALAVLGVVPSFLSPWAEWRRPACRTGRVAAILNAAAFPDQAQALLGDLRQDPNSPRCVAAVGDDLAEGRVAMPFTDAERGEDCRTGGAPGWWAPIRPGSGEPTRQEGP